MDLVENKEFKTISEKFWEFLVKNFIGERIGTIFSINDILEVLLR